MRTEVIKADTIDVAVEGILSELNKSRQNIIYFDGWDGLGASAVLQTIAQRLKLKEPARPPGLEFEHVIHIDCSKWESTRVVQREIAKQLKLPTRVMEMFDKQEEEDDFNGVTGQGSHTEIADVAAEIQRSTQGRRFLLVLHNGSNEEIDISRLGLSVYGYLTNKVIWTFQGRFRIDPRMKDKVMKNNTTDALLSTSCSERDSQELWSYLSREEATQVACKHGIDPSIVAECYLYMLKLHCTSRRHDYDLTTQVSNYWICDGIIPKVTDIAEAWQVSEALQGEIRLEMDYHQNELPSHLLRYAESIPHWTSPTHGFVLVPTGVVPSGTFQYFDKLGVIKLSRCSFSFSSPPFLCCHSLRFLCLDHCQDLIGTDAEQREGEEDTSRSWECSQSLWVEDEEDTTRSWECFQSLWVLDLRYTDLGQFLSARVVGLMTQLRELNVMGSNYWNMSHLWRQLRNIRKLRVTKSTCYFDKNIFSEMKSLELLDFSGSIFRQSMLGASNGGLKTVIIDGCDLEEISFRGCKELKNLFLKGIFRFHKDLDLSGTSVKTLSFRECLTLPHRIILLGCEELRAILWPNEGLPRWSGVLYIDTTSTSPSADGREEPHPCPHGDGSLQREKEQKFKDGWKISLRDARLLRSLYPVIEYLDSAAVHIDVCSAAIVGSSSSNVKGTRSDNLVQVQPHESTMYRDVLKDGLVAPMIIWEWDCRTIPALDQTCIIKVIMHGQCKDAPSFSTSALLLPDFIYRTVSSLHVYNNWSITGIPEPSQGSGWTDLRWCRVERCPKLHTVFSVHKDSGVGSFYWLCTFWASQLLSARYIWTWPVKYCFKNLMFLHLDYCPRLLHVLPLSIHSGDGDLFSYLETLEIVWCGDLKEVYPLSYELQDQDEIIQFASLRHIHLHELPMLQHICGRRMYAPNLKTIKIGGCWSLRRLPAIGRDTKPPKVDCEKEWWDNLEWDGVEKYHHSSLYKPSHSKYYKAKLPRGSLLR